MIVGSTLFHDGVGTAPYYTPSFPRGGLAATFAVDVTHMTGGSLVVKVDGRNDDETAWTTIATFTSITAAGVGTKDATSLKENLRLAFTFSAGAAGDFAHVVISPPAWRPYN